MINRLFALLLLCIFIFPIAILVIIATLDTQQWGVFTQKRVGLHGKPFTIFKIRTLKGSYDSTVTSSKMKRSLIGDSLRYYHFDELPQLINILLGNMNFVGPRPDTEDLYALLNSDDFEKLTSVRPGLTGITQIQNFNEEELLAEQENPEQYYKDILWPKKVKDNIEYLQNRTFHSDLKIIFDTLKMLS